MPSTSIRAYTFLAKIPTQMRWTSIQWSLPYGNRLVDASKQEESRSRTLQCAWYNVLRDRPVRCCTCGRRRMVGSFEILVCMAVSSWKLMNAGQPD